MTVKGCWRTVQMPDYEADYPDMTEPAPIPFKGDDLGEFAFGCVTGGNWGARDPEAFIARLWPTSSTAC
jgi:hypothetical protein